MYKLSLYLKNTLLIISNPNPNQNPINFVSISRAMKSTNPNFPRRLMETESLQQGNTTGSPSYVGEMNFDAHMVVILAALLCALIGALGVNSIVRCIFTCGDRFRPESATGLKRRELRQIPAGIYGSDVGAKIRGSDCAICLGEFENGDMVRVLPICSHGFHLRCIDAWLLSHSSCPNCRHSLLQPPPGKGKQASAAVSPPDSVSSHVVVVVESGN